MKNMKKLSALIFALGILSATTLPYSASAVYQPENSYEEVKKYLDDYGYTYVTELEMKTKNNPNIRGDRQLFFEMPENPYSQDQINVIVVTKEEFEAVFVTFSADNGKEILVEAIDELGINGLAFEESINEYHCRLYGDNSLDDARKLYEYLQENSRISEFIYETELYTIEDGFTSNELLGEYGFTNYNYDENCYTTEEEMLEKYNKLVDIAAELLPDGTVEKTVFRKNDSSISYIVKVIPAQEITIQERIAFGKKTYEEIGEFGGIAILENSFVVPGANQIDFVKAVKGDANGNDILELSDAVMILQTIGNPDEYGLTPQGEYNADIVGEDDGITNADALAVQRKLLKLE